MTRTKRKWVGLLVPAGAVLALAVGFADALPPEPKRRSDPLPARALARLQAQPLACIAGRSQSVLFSPDGKRLAFVEWKVDDRGDRSFPFHFQDAATGKDLWTLPSSRFSSIAFSPDGKLLAAAGDAAVHLLDAGTGKELRTFPVRSKMEGAKSKPEEWTFAFLSVGAIAFTPDGKMLAAESHLQGGKHFDIDTGSITPQFTLWEVATGKVIQETFGNKGAFFHVMGFSAEPRPAKKGLYQWHGVLVQEVGLGDRIRGLNLLRAVSADGKTLAVADTTNNRFQLQESVTGTIRWKVDNQRDRVKAPQCWPRAVYFSPDGRLLVCEETRVNEFGQGHHEAFLWSLTGDRKAARPAPLSAKELEMVWADLADADAAVAYRALVTLLTVPDQAAKFLGGRTRALAAPYEVVAQLLKDLDADEFEVRENASQELGKKGETVDRLLRKALGRNPSPEVQRRLMLLLEQSRASGSSDDLLRGIRVVEALETIGTPEAKAVLQTLARGTPESWLTEEAAVAVTRLGRP